MLKMIVSKDSLLVVVDMQEKFRPIISCFDDIVSTIGRLIKSFSALGFSVIFTEQYPTGLGPSVNELLFPLEGCKKIEKTSFDCFENSKFLEYIQGSSVKDILLCGIESHVCILQTALSALSHGLNVYIIADAVSSRRKIDHTMALRYMESQGVKIVTAEMIIFHLLGSSKHPKFREILKILKQ
jgi:nicotinamidase-related amidase